ncbi:MAG TPA: HDIG domain-containing protein [Candidatus Portnoybacteria bacterium]|nr:HDIG domain-containing protein [Candidatus Portnoybacteria bacterium]
MNSLSIPLEILRILAQLKKNGWDGFLVGGCVRDSLIGREPKDWDITTKAKPEEIQKIFPDSFYDNQFGTVGIKTEKNGVVEITTFRAEGKYTDQRHPDEISWAKTLKEDLARRDFTINALAIEIQNLDNLDLEKNADKELKIEKIKIVDLFGGQDDLKKRIIRAVGNPVKRFSEDALRMMRAIRLAIELNFKIDENTLEAIQKNSSLIKNIAQERIRDELVKILITPRAADGIDLLRRTSLLKFIIPELLLGYHVSQNLHHIYDVYTHNLKALEAATKKNYSLEIRLAALLHDIGKPKVKNGKGKNATFYNHQIVGAKMAWAILRRLKFSREITDKVVLLIRNHMFVYDVDQVKAAGVRRVVKKVGLENIQGLINLRICDRLGSGCPKAMPYKLRHFQYMVEKVSRDAISAKMLKINGEDIIRELKISPGPKIGSILDLLLAEVIYDPRKNKR